MRFLRNLNVPFKSDTAYVFIVPPMNAARVEGGISPFARLLRKAGVMSDIVTLAVSNRRRAAERYLERRAFASDYNLVTDESCLSSFVFSAGFFGVPFATKFCVKTGELLSSYSLLGVTDSATVAWLIADTSKPRAERPAGIRRTRIETVPYRPAIGKRTKLLDCDENPLSTSDYVSISPSGSRLALMDKLTYYIYVFDLSDGRMVNALFPDTSEQMKFVNVQAADYRWLEQNNVVNSMYFSHAFLDDTTLLVSATLPRVVYQISGTDTSTRYSNTSALIEKNVRENNPIRLASFQPMPKEARGHMVHTSASFVCGRDLVFVPFAKGWPSGSQSFDEKIPPEGNPFDDEFYRGSVYQFVAYALDGSFVGLWGRLGSRFEKLRLGYYPGGGLVRFHNGTYLLSNQHSGAIYTYNPDATLRDSITLFEDPPLVFPAIDRLQEPERYLIEAFKQNFRAKVVDFVVTDDHCYALVIWDESQPIVHKVGLKDHTTQKYALPARYQGKEAKHYLLRATPTGIVTASLLESGDETWYCEFKLP